MNHKFVIALDGSARAERVLPWVRKLAPNEEHVLVQVVPAGHAPDYARNLRDEKQTAERYLGRLAKDFTPPAKVAAPEGSPAPKILEAADKYRASYIAMTSRGASTPVERVLGSVTEKLIHGSPYPLLVVPVWKETPRSASIRRLIVPLDGSRNAESILPLAMEIAEEQNAEMILAHIWGGRDRTGPEYTALETRLNFLKVKAEKEDVKARVVITSGILPDQTLHQVADNEQGDMFVLSAYGQGAVKRLFVGSLALKLLRETDLPVLVARPEALRWMKTERASARRV